MGDYDYNIVEKYGCLFTTVVNVGNTERQKIPNISASHGNPARPLGDYNMIRGSDDLPKYFKDTWNENTGEYDSEMSPSRISSLLHDMTGKDYNVGKLTTKAAAKSMLETYKSSTSFSVYFIGKVKQRSGTGFHFINVLGFNNDGTLQVHDPLGNGRTYTIDDLEGGYVIIEKKRDLDL
jgi:hypothetical protein